MANFIKFFDTVQFQPVETDVVKNKDNFQSNVPGSPLIVKIAATHSGLITRNNGFYLPDRMRKGAASFTAHYGKPIQVHHNDGADPVGRVIKAEYVDISSGIRDSFLQKVLNRTQNRFSDQMIKDFITGDLPYIQSVNLIVDSLNYKDSVLDDPSYKGLGYILLTASIADQEAKQKILDGRYLTGSVGVTTNHAVCSVCKQDWTGDDGRCEHKPGKIYDGAKAFIITGDLTYDEYSFVNVPADRHSGILQINVDGITDSLTMENSVGRPISVNLFRDNIDIGKSTDTINVSQEEPMSKKEKAKELLLSLKPTYEFATEDAVKAITDCIDNLELGLDSLEEVEIAAYVGHQLDKWSVEAIFKLDNATRLDALKKLRPFMEESGLKTVADATYETLQLFSDALNETEWNDYSELEDEALVAYLVEHPEDAKLSGAQRKRLPGSTFCGPNKSFPVPDVTHVDTTRRLIDKASISAPIKAKILSSVTRKATAMNYGAKDQVTEEAKPAGQTVEKTVTTEEVKDNAAVPCVSCDALKQTVSDLETKVTALSDQLKTLLDTTKDQTTTIETLGKDFNKSVQDLDATRTELKLAHEDLMQMSDQLVAVQEDSVKLLVDQVCVFKQLSGQVIEDFAKFTDELTALGKDGILDQLKEVTVKVDMKKITDSINSGLTRNPTGSINDPTLNLVDQKKVYVTSEVKAASEQYMKLLFSKGKDAAERFRREMQIQGVIPNSNG